LETPNFDGDTQENLNQFLQSLEEEYMIDPDFQKKKMFPIFYQIPNQKFLWKWRQTPPIGASVYIWAIHNEKCYYENSSEFYYSSLENMKFEQVAWDSKTAPGAVTYQPSRIHQVLMKKFVKIGNGNGIKKKRLRQTVVVSTQGVKGYRLLTPKSWTTFSSLHKICLT
jgi:hypothetical protein